MKKGIIITLILCMILCLCACGTAETPANPETPAENPAQTTGTETPASSEKPLELVIITQSWDNIFFVQMRDAALAYAEKLDNVNVTVMAGADINEQLKLMEDFTVQKPDAIAVCSYDASAIVPGIETAMAAGIPVFCLDNNCTGTEIVSFIGTDNVLGGYLMGKYINEVMGGEGKMAVIEGPAGNFNSNIRRQGMDQAFEEIGSKVEVVASISANWKRDQGLTVANDIITSTPDLKLIFCLNDEMAFGAMQAIEASGRDITLVAYNGVPEAFMNIYNGHMLATVAQYPETFATTYIDCAIALVRDGVQPEATYAIPAAVVDYDLIHDVVDNNKTPTNEEETILYNKLKTYYQG